MFEVEARISPSPSLPPPSPAIREFSIWIICENLENILGDFRHYSEDRGVNYTEKNVEFSLVLSFFLKLYYYFIIMLCLLFILFVLLYNSKGNFLRCIVCFMRWGVGQFKILRLE